MGVLKVPVLALLAAFALVACNDDKDPAPPLPPPTPAATHTVGGTVSGLAGSVTLANNGGDARTVSANGAFTFTTTLTSGAAYAVTVTSQPANQTCAVASGTGTLAANVTSVTVTCETYRVVASIGPAGGTVTHPGGAEVVIPAGALTQSTDIAISRTASGWPALADDMATAAPVYEFTPHDLVFHRPVLIRLPAPATTSPLSTFFATMGQDWAPVEVVRLAQRVEFERNTFSWFWGPWACASNQEINPYDCWPASGMTWATATPATALMMTSGSAGSPRELTSAANTAGFWQVDNATLTDLQLTMRYSVAPDCVNGQLTLRRVAAGQTPVMQVVGQVGASQTNGEGQATIAVPRAEIAAGLNTFSVGFSCRRPTATRDFTAIDWITFEAASNPLNGFTLGGSITGLTTGGLVLQNGARERLAVAGGSTTFQFGTLQAPGSAFSVRIRNQPLNGNCSIANGSGTSNANVSNIAVTCTTTQPTFAGLTAVANSGSRNLSYYRVDSSNGALTGPLNENMDTSPGSTPVAVAIAANGRFTYVANSGSNAVFTRLIEPSQFYSMQSFPSMTTPNPVALAVDSVNTAWLWVANGSAGAVTTFAINPTTGSLTAAGAATPTVAALPVALAQSPNGNFLYSAHPSGHSIVTFSIDHATGALTAVGAPLSGAVSSPGAIVFSPNGLRAYVTSSGATIVRLAADPSTGALSAPTPTAISAASQLDALAIRPDGAFLYAATSSAAGARIQVFSIDATTGALTFVTAVNHGTPGVGKLALGRGGTTLYATLRPANTIATYAIDAASGIPTLLDTDATGTDPEGVAAAP